MLKHSATLTGKKSGANYRKTLVVIALASALSLGHAADTLTESSFSGGSYTATDTTVGSINFVGNSGSTFTLNPSDTEGTVIIDPSLDNGAAIFIDGDSSQSTLNITGSVEVAGTSDNRLTTDDAPLIAVGYDEKKDGGHLTVEGELKIQHADVLEYSGVSVVNVGSGSSLTIGDVSIHDVTVTNTKTGYPRTATSVLEVRGSSGSTASLNAGKVTITDTTAEHVMDFENAAIDLGDVEIDGSSFGSGISAGKGADVTIGSLDVGTSDFTSSLLLANAGSKLTVTNGITVKGTADDHIQASGRGTSYFLKFTAADSVAVEGAIQLEYIDTNSSLLFVSEVDGGATFGDITLDHITIGAQQSALQIGGDDDGQGKFTAGDITVKNLAYAEAGRYQWGVKVSEVDEATIDSISVDGVTFGETTSTSTVTTTQGNGGIKINDSTFTKTLATLSAKNIKSQDADAKIGFSGISVQNGTFNAGEIVVDTVESAGSTGSSSVTTEGVLIGLSSQVGYGSISVNHIASAGDAYGLHTTGSTTLTGLENAEQTVKVTNVKGGRAWGVNIGNNNAFSGKSIWVETVTATGGTQSTDGDVTGINAGGKLTFDSVTVKSVQGTKGASGLTLNYAAALDVGLLAIDGVKSTDASNTKSSYGIKATSVYSGKPQQKVDAVAVKNVSAEGTGDVFGFYNEDAVWVGDRLEIDTVSAQNGSAFGFDSYGYSLEGSLSYVPTSVDYDTIVVSNVSGNEALGFRNRGRTYNYGNPPKSTVTSDWIQVAGVTGTKSAAGLDNQSALNTSTAIVRNVASGEGEAVGITNSGTNASYESGVNIVDGVHGATSAIGFEVLTSLTADTVFVNDVVTTKKGDAAGIYLSKASLNTDAESGITLVATNVSATDGAARGLYLDQRNTSLAATDFLSIGSVHATGGDAAGIYFTNTVTGDLTNTNGLFVQDIRSDKNAHGIYLQNASSSLIAGDVFVSGVGGAAAYGIRVGAVESTDGLVYVGDVHGTNAATGLFTSKGSEISQLWVTGVTATSDYATANGVNHLGSDAVTYKDAAVISDITGGLQANGVLARTNVRFEAGVSVSNVSATAANGSAYGIHADNEGAATSIATTDLSISTVSGNTAYGVFADERNVTATGSAVISGVEGEDKAAGVMADNSTATFGSLQITNVAATGELGRSVVLGARNGAVVTAASGFLTSERVADGYQPAYVGHFADDADLESNHITNLALRSVSGASVTLGNAGDDTTPAGGRFTIVGSMVAGLGTSEEGAQAGTIDLHASEGSAIYGDVYAGNGGIVTLHLQGSVIEGQIDDYHELTSGTAESSSFRNAVFYDDESGVSLDVTTAGNVSLTLDASTWTARGQSFVKNVTFAGEGSVIDLSQNENSSVTIDTLTGSNGTFRMRLGKPEVAADGLIHSDMLYIANLDPNSQNRIDVVFADGVESFEDLDGLRFATSNHVETTKHLQLKVENAGFFNRTLGVELETYEEGDEENALYNGADDGSGSYKPGENAVDGMFDTGDTNWVINSKDDPVGPEGPSVSDAGQTILGTARATYWNAVILDRFNQRYGDRVYDQNHNGVWARVKYEHIGTDAGVGDFSSDNTTYQFGYDYTKPTENGKMIWGGAIDYMDGRTDYKSINGDGGTDRIGALLYATYLADNGAYTDLVLRAGRLSADYQMSTPSGTKLDADYNHWMYGISFEAGHQLENGTGWFLEPQLQAQYTRITDGDYRNQQTRVEQDAIDSLITRAGFRVGKFLSDSKATLSYFKVDVMREWMGEQDIRVYDVTTAAEGADVSLNNHGTWFDVGGGFQAAVTQDLYAYGDVEYRFGNDLDNTWIVNIGAKYRF